MVRRAFAAVAVATLLAGCSEPVFVPEAGPGAPGYRRSAAPPPPRVEVLRAAGSKTLPAGGVIDGVVRKDESFEITGWALIDADPPRGVLRLVVPTGFEARVLDVETTPRPDVVEATHDDALIWSGFTVTVRGSLPDRAGVCMLSRSKRGAFRLGGSDEGLCPL